MWALYDLRKNSVFEFCNLILLYANHNVDNIQRLSISTQNCKSTPVIYYWVGLFAMLMVPYNFFNNYFFSSFHSHQTIYRLEDTLEGNFVKRIGKSIRKVLDIDCSNLNF